MRKIFFLLITIYCFQFTAFSQEPVLTLNAGHSGAVSSVSYSPDGKYVLSGSFDKTIKLWEVSTNKEVRTFSGHSMIVESVCFSPDGKYALSGSDDCTLKLWEISTGKEVRTFAGHTKSVSSVCFSPDGKYALSGSDDNTIKLWEVSTGKLLRTFFGHTAIVKSVCFSADGKFALSGSGDKTIIQWDVSAGKAVRVFAGHAKGITSVCFSPDGKYALSGSDDNTLKLWDISTGKEIITFSGHIKGITSVCFSPDNKYALSGSYDNTVKLWEISSGKMIKTFSGHAKSVTSVCLSPDGKNILSGSSDKTLKLWDISTGKEIGAFSGHANSVFSVCYSPDGNYILSGSYDNTLKLWDISTGKEIRIFTGHSGLVNSVCFSADGVYALSGSADSTLRLWNISTGKEIKVFSGHSGPVYSVCFSSDGKYALSGSGDQTLKLWDISTGKELRTFSGHTKAITSVCFSPDGKYAFSGGYDGSSKLWDVSTGKEVRTLSGFTGWVYSVCFSPDGKYALSGSSKTLTLYDVSTGRVLRIFSGHANYISSVSFSPDGKYILSGSYDNTLKLWDVSSGKELKTFSGHSSRIYSACFSPDGKYIASGSQDKTIKIWNVASGKEMCSIVYIDKADWLVVTSDGRFDGTEGGMGQMYWVKGMEVIEFNLLKDRYWEPGLWKKIMKGEQLWNIQGMNELKLQPEVNLTEIKNEKLPITLTKRDGGYGKVVIQINGKEVEADARGNGFDTTKDAQTILFDIKNNPLLIPGKQNTITVKAWSADGFVEGRGVNILYKSEEDTVKFLPSLYAVVLGVSDYSSTAIHLKYAQPDAIAIAASIKLGAENLFGKDRTFIYTLTSPGEIKPTKENIKNVFEQIKSKAKNCDVLVIYMSGHGITWGDNPSDFYYLTADAHSAASESYSDNAIRNNCTISSKEFTDWILKIGALKQLVIIDACGSGKAVDNLIAQRNIEGSQVKAIDRMKDRTGMFIISGCAADAVSYEASRYGQGLLTYTILQAMKGVALREDKFVDVNTLLNYSREEVPKLAAGVGGIQEPQLLIPKGGSFDIGIMNENDKAKIPLAKPRPMFVRSSFLDADQLEDMLGLSTAVDDALNSLSAKGNESPIIFLDTRNYPDGCKISGTYTQKSGKINLKYKIKCGEKVEEHTAEGNTTEELVKEITIKAGLIKN